MSVRRLRLSAVAVVLASAGLTACATAGKPAAYDLPTGSGAFLSARAKCVASGKAVVESEISASGYLCAQDLELALGGGSRPTRMDLQAGR